MIIVKNKIVVGAISKFDGHILLLILKIKTRHVQDPFSRKISDDILNCEYGVF